VEEIHKLVHREVCKGERGNEEGVEWKRRLRGDQRGGNLYVKKYLKLLKKRKGTSKCTKEMVRERRNYKTRYFRNLRLPIHQLNSRSQTFPIRELRDEARFHEEGKKN
jgi:hypothetical protein